jgi:dipeptidyl aminopeptidase/acylaminoacyl peptidase
VADTQAMWWVWPETGLLRQVGPPQPERAYLVAVSPDGRWVTYYQRQSQVQTDRFVVDSWVMDLATDERTKLVEGNSPIGWIADHNAVVLGERPQLMALVPSGSLEPTTGQLVLADSMRGSTSPDGRLRAAVATMPTGAAGVNIVDVQSGEPLMNIPTGRGAVQLAWSPDSNYLAYTSGVDSPQGLTWRLRMVDLSDKSVSLLDATGDMDIHTVVWAPALSGCS